MTKTLKNKYFPHSSFMEAKESSMASFTWTSILCAKGLVEKGLVKTVGDENNTDT